MKGFIFITKDFYLNEDIVKEIKEYDDKIKVFTIYDEKYIIKKENKDEKVL